MLPVPLVAVQVNKSIVFPKEFIVERFISFLQGVQLKVPYSKLFILRMLQEPKSAEWPWDGGESPTALGKLGWGKNISSINMIVSNGEEKGTRFHRWVCDWVKVRIHFPWGQSATPICSPLVFDKFDIPLLSTGVPNVSRNSCRHVPQT